MSNESYQQGWRAGLALGALSVAAVSLINFFTLEKSILAIVLALIAISGAGEGRTRRRGRWALVLAVLHLAIVALLLTLFRDRLEPLIVFLQSQV